MPLSLHRGRNGMHPDIFGALHRKNEVLAKLGELASRNCLDEHQIGLARILRFKQNPGLLQAALEYSAQIRKASDILIAEVLNTLVAQDLTISTRASAAGVLGHLICRRPSDEATDFDLDFVVESMEHVLQRTKSRVIKKALFEALELVRNKNLRNGGRTAISSPPQKGTT